MRQKANNQYPVEAKVVTAKTMMQVDTSRRRDYKANVVWMWELGLKNFKNNQNSQQFILIQTREILNSSQG